MSNLYTEFSHEHIDLNLPTFLTPGHGTHSTGPGYLTSIVPQPFDVFLGHFQAPQDVIEQVKVDPLNVNYTFYFRDRRSNLSSRNAVAPETIGYDLNDQVLLLNIGTIPYTFRVQVTRSGIRIRDRHSSGGSNYGSVYGVKVWR